MQFYFQATSQVQAHLKKKKKTLVQWGFFSGWNSWKQIITNENRVRGLVAHQFVFKVRLSVQKMQWFQRFFLKSNIKYSERSEYHVQHFQWDAVFNIGIRNYGRILDYFGHFIDKKFKSEINPRIYDQQVKQKYCKYLMRETLQLLYRADFQNFFNSWVITFQPSVNTLLLPKYNYLVHFPLLWGSAFKNVIALPHWQLKISQHSFLMKSYMFSSFIHFL